MTRPKLTAAQSKRVRELMTDEGHTRASAVAWVQAFEIDGAQPIVCDAKANAAIGSVLGALAPALVPPKTRDEWYEDHDELVGFCGWMVVEREADAHRLLEILEKPWNWSEEHDEYEAWIRHEKTRNDVPQSECFRRLP